MRRGEQRSVPGRRCSCSLHEDRVALGPWGSGQCRSRRGVVTAYGPSPPPCLGLQSLPSRAQGEAPSRQGFLQPHPLAGDSGLWPQPWACCLLLGNEG